MITFWAAILVLASIGVVGWPLIKGGGGRDNRSILEDAEVGELLAQKDATLFAISELESDYNMGNLSKGDYRETRQRYEDKAVALLKTVDKLRSERGLDGVSSIDEEIEARVAEMRGRENTRVPDAGPQAARPRGAQQGAAGLACRACGAKLEAGDLFCFRCGASANARCPKCSAAVDSDDRFCSGCGAALNPGGDHPKMN